MSSNTSQALFNGDNWKAVGIVAMGSGMVFFAAQSLMADVLFMVKDSTAQQVRMEAMESRLTQHEEMFERMSSVISQLTQNQVRLTTVVERLDHLSIEKERKP